MNAAATRCIACCALALFYGCTTVPDATLGPPLEARWYFERAAQPQIEILLVNRTPRDIPVSKVFLNEYDRVEDRDGSRTWMWVLDKEFVLEPGGYKILATNAFSRAASGSPPTNASFTNLCLLPVSLAIEVPAKTHAWLLQTYGRLIGELKDRVLVDMPDRLPSAIPTEWRKCKPETP
jgi:hypothetical protein